MLIACKNASDQCRFVGEYCSPCYEKQNKTIIENKQQIIKVNSVVQVNPELDDMFAGCFVIVTDLKPWGIQGYAQNVETHPQGQIYIRLNWEQIEYIGHAEWVVSNV